MAVSAVKLTQQNTKLLQTQLDACPAVTGKLQDVVKSFLFDVGIYSLLDVTLEDLAAYRETVSRMPGLKSAQKKSYGNLLEQVVFAFRISENKNLTKWADECIPDKARKNKTTGFLLLIGVTAPENITYQDRTLYQQYLMNTIAKSKVSEYMKALDLLKLDAIRRDNERGAFRKRKLSYVNDKIFLLYHPSYDLATTFYYVRDKEELVFDFSVNASGLMKHQVLKMLNHILDTVKDLHDRRERFLLPLKLLYEYCVEHQIEDIELLTQKDEEGFYESIDGKVGSKTQVYMQIIYNIRKYLFMDAKEINWDANVWYMERFSDMEERSNPAREIKKFSFSQIENHRNRSLFKQYMKYLIGLSKRLSLQTIRCHYYDIRAFLVYLDGCGVDVAMITGKELEKYFVYFDGIEIQPEYFNRMVKSIRNFLNYLVVKGKMTNIPMHMEYYLKKTFQRHNDRSVPPEKQIEILRAIKDSSPKMKLMFLNLIGNGLRVSEVCTIKGKNYIWDGEDAWLCRYQTKMKMEKKQPTLQVIYELMQKYIEENQIGADDYVFPDKKGGAYDAGTFTKQFKQILKDAGVEGYAFRSHDFRHSLASMYSQAGVPIDVIRDILGHKDTDMTMNYIDYMQAKIDASSDEYFAAKENRLAEAAAKKEVRNE